MKIFSMDFRRALCVLLLAPIGWLTGWQSVSAATGHWHKSGDNFQVQIGGITRYWNLSAYCCPTSNYDLGNCEQIGDTGTSPMATVLSVPYNDFYSRCAANPYMRVNWADNTNPSQFSNMGAQTWPSAPSAYDSNQYVQFFLWTSPVWLILLLLWWIRR